MGSSLMQHYMMTFEEYKALTPVEKLKLWIEVDTSLIRKFLEFDYKLKKINNLKELYDTSNK